MKVANANGWTALHSMAAGHDSIVRPLLDKDANLSATDKDGDTALFTAAFSGMKSTVELLLKREADTNATSMRLQFERCEYAALLVPLYWSLVLRPRSRTLALLVVTFRNSTY